MSSSRHCSRALASPFDPARFSLVSRKLRIVQSSSLLCLLSEFAFLANNNLLPSSYHLTSKLAKCPVRFVSSSSSFSKDRHHAEERHSCVKEHGARNRLRSTVLGEDGQDRKKLRAFSRFSQNQQTESRLTSLLPLIDIQQSTQALSQGYHVPPQTMAAVPHVSPRFSCCSNARDKAESAKSVARLGVQRTSSSHADPASTNSTERLL